MRETNCERMTRMIPLYVAGDLVGEPEREAAAHLAACQACKQLAEEFSESSRLLTQAFAPPEFGAEFYTGIRHAVLGKIADQSITSRSGLFGQWGRRWLYAGAFAAVVIATVTLLVFRGLPREPSRELAFSPPAGPATPDQTKELKSASSLELSDPLRKSDQGTAQKEQRHKLFALTDSRKRNSQIDATKKSDAQDTARTAKGVGREIAAAIAIKSAVPESVISSRRSASSAVAASGEISRIEMQTGDPNIRIIWLSPRNSREPEQLNHNQDPEMGDRN